MATTTTTPIPAVLAGHALRSLRESGFTLPAALAEVIDNSIEADANSIVVHLEEELQAKGKKAHICRIAVADDGTGMGADDQGRDVLQHYLQLGYSTRYMRTDTIGKFGVGAKLGALNFCEQIDVWSRTDGESPWRHARFDLEAAEAQEAAGEPVTIDAPDAEPVPEDLEFLMPEGSGTLVVWSKIDRLEHGRWGDNAAELRGDIEKELSRTFRYFLNGGISIRVNETDLLAHDPLFLMKNTWADTVLAKEARRQAAEEAKKNGEKAKGGVPGHFEAKVLRREPLKAAGKTAELIVTLYPPEVTRRRYQGGDPVSQRLRVPDNEGQISFVRLNREINYTNVPKSFETAVLDIDRFIGVEVRFTPELDEYFGVRNVKRGVEPHGEIRAQMRKVLGAAVKEARAIIQERWDVVDREEAVHAGEHARVNEAVKDANRVLPKSRAKDEPEPDKKDEALRHLAADVGKDEPDEQEAYVEEAREMPIVIETVDYPGQSFVDVQHVAGQVILRLNSRHRFYRELWEPIRTIAQQNPGTVSGAEAVETCRRTLTALQLMLMAYGKAESMHPSPRDQYGELRNYWGTFMDSLMGQVKDLV